MCPLAPGRDVIRRTQNLPCFGGEKHDQTRRDRPHVGSNCRELSPTDSRLSVRATRLARREATAAAGSAPRLRSPPLRLRRRPTEPPRSEPELEPERGLGSAG